MKKLLLVAMLLTGMSLGQSTGEFKKYKNACDTGNAKGCYNLGLMYYKGISVRQNKSKAKELFGKACKYGYAYSCSAVGYANYPNSPSLRNFVNMALSTPHNKQMFSDDAEGNKSKVKGK
jgi:TPR repeat protein